MEPRLQDFLKRILNQAINSGIAAFFWRLPALWIFVIVAALIAAAIYFGLY